MHHVFGGHPVDLACPDTLEVEVLKRNMVKIRYWPSILSVRTSSTDVIKGIFFCLLYIFFVTYQDVLYSVTPHTV